MKSSIGLLLTIAGFIGVASGAAPLAASTAVTPFHFPALGGTFLLVSGMIVFAKRSPFPHAKIPLSTEQLPHNN
jgi:hypothetical protein